LCGNIGEFNDLIKTLRHSDISMRNLQPEKNSYICHV